MNASFVCSACRQRVYITARRIVSQQWLSSATFVSLSNARDSTDDTLAEGSLALESENKLGDGGTIYAPTSDTQAGDDTRVNKRLLSGGEAGMAESKSTFVSLSTLRTAGIDLSEETRMVNRDTNKTGNTTITSTRQRTQRRERNRHEGHLLGRFFREQPTTPTTTGTVNLEIYAHIETLKGMLNNSGHTVFDTWKFFVSNLGPRVWTPKDDSTTRPLGFDALAGQLNHKLKIERLNSRVLSSVPTVTDILSTYAALGLLRPVDWIDYISDLLCKLSKETSSELQSPTAAEKHLMPQNSHLDLLLMSEDLLRAWRLACKFYSSSNMSFHAFKDDDLEDWSFLTPIVLKKLQKVKAKDGMAGPINHLLPRSPIHHRNSFSSMAFITFALLTRNSIIEKLPDIKQHPFVLIIAQILSNTLITSSEIDGSLRNPILSDALRDIEIDWSLVIKMAKSLEPRGSRPVSRFHLHKALGTSEDQASEIRKLIEVRKVKTSLKCPSLRNVHKELASALAERNLTLVNELWESAKQADISVELDSIPKNSLADNEIVLSHGLCNHFILTYTGLGQPDRAIDVWNHMIKLSLYPNLSTWNAMLEGCRRSRSITSLEGIWAKLLASGLQPDTVCWTTRISCLIECRKPKLAVRALEEMGKTWFQATRKKGVKDVTSVGDIGGVIKPTIQMINAAITGLLHRGELNLANSILAWGGRLGIKPDIITFNTLLRSFVRDGRSNAVQALLKHMEKQGVQTDAGTFTTILDEMFRNSDAQSPEEQNKIVDSVFAEMEAAGVKANLHTYGKIIYHLLQSRSEDMTAVSAIIRRMTAEGLQPSTHIFTLLANHHFSQEPPDLGAIRFLLEFIRLSGATVDQIFWNNVIRGYARAGETASALMILGKEDREGSRVSWQALETVIIALIENQERVLARQVVQNVRIDRGPPPLTHEANPAERNFWKTVVDLELLSA